jgi:predicted transcriptional regulator
VQGPALRVGFAEAHAGAPAKVAVLTQAQERVLAIVTEQPGCSIQHVALQLRASHATAGYHLYALSRLGLLVQVRDGREVRHFPGAAAPGSCEYLQALARDPRKASLLAVLAGEPPEALTIHQMAQRAKVTFSVAKRTLQQLEWAGVVTLERRRYRYIVRVEPSMRARLQETLDGAAAEQDPIGTPLPPGRHA